MRAIFTSISTGKPKREPSFNSIAFITLFVLILSPAVGFASSDESELEKFGGTWTGTWPSGLEIELTVNDVDEEGYVYGLYCNLRSHGIWFTDLHPEDGRSAQTKQGKLRFQQDSQGGPTIKWEFSPTSNDTLELTWRRGAQSTHRLDLSRIDSGKCTSRVVPLSR